MKLFTYFFLIFMLAMSIHRIWETFFREKGKKGKIIKKWTLPVLSILHFIVGIGTFIEFLIIKREMNFTITTVGFIMFIIALLGRNWAIKTLGEYHSIHIEIREDHPLIKKGPYIFLRHPYYLSVILELLGIPLIANAFYSFIFSLLVYIPFLLLRVYFEEKAMIDKFNNEYIQYKKETWGFLPLKKIRIK